MTLKEMELEMETNPLDKMALTENRRQKRYIPHKWRKVTQEEKDLEKWKSTYEIVKLTRNQYLEDTIRKLRLSQLFQFIKDNLKNTKKRKARVKVRKASTDPIKMRWSSARKKGNEYSQFNKYNIFTIPNLPPLYPDNSKQRLLSAVSARVYGNLLSNMNIKRLQNTRRRHRSHDREIVSETEILKEKRRNLLDYGSYYSMRNRLSLKDDSGQFDHEYQDLLLKCVAFEKDHIEITGFLEEKFRSNIEFRRGMIALAYQESNQKPNEPQMVKDTIKPKKQILVASTQHTRQIMDLERIPSNEEFESVTRIARMQSVPAVPSDVKGETLVNAVRYASHVHLSSSSKILQENKLRSYMLSEKPLSENDTINWITDSVTSNDYFEDTILDVMKGYRSTETDSVETQKLLSDLYLAFSMNLMKTAINEKFIKEEVDIVAVREAAVKQADAMSEALSEIFRSKSGFDS